MNLGICTAGLETEFERALRERAKAGEPFVYLEIGTAYCDTWLAVCRVLTTTQANWRTVAVDPWTHSLENYMAKIAPEFGPDKALMLVQTREEAFRTEMERIGNRLDFVFIDGCHAEPCVRGDFLAVEPLVVPGGLVVFHDIFPEPSNFQPHCQQGSGVRYALAGLGLMDGDRRGWRRKPDWIADRALNGADCGVFEKL